MVIIIDSFVEAPLVGYPSFGLYLFRNKDKHMPTPTFDDSI